MLLKLGVGLLLLLLLPMPPDVGGGDAGSSLAWSGAALDLASRFCCCEGRPRLRWRSHDPNTGLPVCTTAASVKFAVVNFPGSCKRK